MHRWIPALVVLLAVAAVALFSGTATAKAAGYTCPIDSISTPFLNGGVQVNSYHLQCNGDDSYAYGLLLYEAGGEWINVSAGGSLACVFWPGGGTHCSRGAGGYAADGSNHNWGPHTYSVLTDFNTGASLAPYCSHNFKVKFSAYAKTTLPPPPLGYTITSATLAHTC